jgi:hypothetical protein
MDAAGKPSSGLPQFTLRIFECRAAGGGFIIKFVAPTQILL